MRTYDTGATRNTNKGKPDYAGYTSFAAMQRFGQYMLEHQKQADGTFRASDNWKKGIPINDYKESAYRHTVDLLALLERNEGTAKQIEDLACAVLFNWQGFLHEWLNESIRKKNCASGTSKSLVLTERLDTYYPTDTDYAEEHKCMED